jgi:hypothetical protein
LWSAFCLLLPDVVARALSCSADARALLFTYLAVLRALLSEYASMSISQNKTSLFHAFLLRNVSISCLVRKTYSIIEIVDK